MKSENKYEKGSVLLVTVVLTAILAVAIAGYFQLVKSQSSFISRSQNWNSSLAMSEAGAEEAFALINKNQMSMFTPAYGWTNNLVADGWSALTNNVTSLTRFIGADSGFTVTVTIPAGGGAPVIDSQGYLLDRSMLLTSSARNEPFFAAVGVTTPAPRPTIVTRKIHVPTMRTNLFVAGISAKQNISLSGGWTVDSFDSGDPGASTGGQYDPAKATDHAVIATDSTSANCLSSGGSVSVKGFAKTGPGGTANFGGNASVGDSAWVNGGNKGIQSGRSVNDMNVFFPDVPIPPYSTWLLPSPGVFGPGLTNCTYFLTGTVANYRMPSSLTIGNGQGMIVSGGMVNLYVDGNINVAGYIYIAPGASLRLFCNGASASLGGQGIICAAGYASDFSFYGLPSCTSFSYGGQSMFMGGVYAPQAAVNMNGGSDYSGAIVANSFSSSGNASFHVDEGLYRNGAGSPYLARSWAEVVAPPAP